MSPPQPRRGGELDRLMYRITQPFLATAPPSARVIARFVPTALFDYLSFLTRNPSLA